MRQRTSTGLALVIIGAAVLLIALAAVLASLSGPSDSTQPGQSVAKDDKGRVVLTVAYSPEKATLFERLAGEFNKQNQRYSLKATKLEMADMLSQALEGRFTAISPDSAIWLGSLDQAWLAQDANRANLVGSLSRYALSPVVLATWQSEAQKMGYPQKAIGWGDIAARATADSNFRWSHPSTTTAAGMLTTTAEFYAARGKTSRLTADDLQDKAAQEYVKKVEATVQQYGAESEDQVLQRLLDQRQRTLDAFVGQEALVVRFNRQTRGERLVAVYPREGTLWMDHPLVLLEGPWLKPEHRRGFQELSDFLRSGPMQRIVMQEGYRPADLGISLDDADSQIKTANGVNPAEPQTMLQIPTFGVVEDIRNLWSLLKRPANIYMVADVSGSMAGDKLNRAKDAFKSFIGQVRGNTDRLALISFATDVREIVPLQTVAQNKASLMSGVDDLRSAGNTAMYDAVLLAAERLGDLKQTDRINVVLVMTDGIENASRRVRSSKDVTPLINSLKQVETRTGVHVLVFSVAYGADADLNTLRQLSEATRGQAYQGDPETIGKLYQLLSAFF